ncbi:MAG: LacI family DNA-binding transcriptional regulator [Lachnospiraceae bacterium]
MSKSNPTMKDVAREAGVSLGTVSNVVNNVPVGETYRNRVLDAIEKMNYQVNSIAQGLKADKTRVIALLIPNTTNPFFAKITHFINRSLLQKGYRMLLCTTDSDPTLEQSYVTMAQQNKVDGVIGLTYNPNLVIPPNVPFVAIDRILGPTFPCVASDNFSGGQLAAEKLATLGCKKVAFLRIGSSLSNEPNKRKSGFENGCIQHHLNYEMKILNDGDSMEEFKVFLASHKTSCEFTLDGIFCVTDRIAYTVLKYLEELGVSVPDEVQVIGFDGSKVLDTDDYICSTIVQPIEDIADTCVDLILQEHTTQKPQLICLPVTYACGGTTKEEVS